MLKTFANSLDPDQARLNVQSDLIPICLTPEDGIPEKFFRENRCKKTKQIINKHANNPVGQRLKHGIGADLIFFLLYLCYRRTVS